MKTKKAAWILLLSLIPIVLIPVILTLMQVAPFHGKDGLLRECKFNEETAEYDICYWKWDQRLSSPSIYY